MWKLGGDNILVDVGANTDFGEQAGMRWVDAELKRSYAHRRKMCFCWLKAVAGKTGVSSCAQLTTNVDTCSVRLIHILWGARKWTKQKVY